MLRGFEGFNGELLRLWSQAAQEIQEETIKAAMEEQPENDITEGFPNTEMTLENEPVMKLIAHEPEFGDVVVHDSSMGKDGE
jgi:hypothetical protein